MALALLIDQPRLRVAQHGAVLKREDYEALLTVRALTGSAQEQARSVLAAAREQYELERERGYRDGLAQARTECAANVGATAAAKAQALRTLQPHIVGIVMRALRNILHEADAELFLQHALRRVSESIKHEPILGLRVSTAQAESARRALAALSAEFGTSFSVEVHAEEDLAAGACIVESANACVDAGLDTQLQAIEQALRNHLTAATED